MAYVAHFQPPSKKARTENTEVHNNFITLPYNPDKPVVVHTVRTFEGRSVTMAPLTVIMLMRCIQQCTTAGMPHIVVAVVDCSPNAWCLLALQHQVLSYFRVVSHALWCICT